MITVVGALLLIVVIIAGLAAIFSTGGDPHALIGDFTVLNYHVTGTASLLLLWGMVVCWVALAVLGRLMVVTMRADRRELLAAHSITAPQEPVAAVPAPSPRR